MKLARRASFVLVFVVATAGLSLGQSRRAVSIEPMPTSKPASRPKRPEIYDTKTDGKAILAGALAKAAKLDKRVLVVFGGNWCGWCHKLHAVLTKENAASPTGVPKLVFNEYETAWIDMGKNEDLVKRYVEKLEGVPYLVVLDYAGTLLTTQETGALEEGDRHAPAKVTAFLEKWRVPPRDAKQVLAEAVARAKSDSKIVFLNVGAPWCGWCHRFEAFLHREDIANILAADFVMTKIDNERMLHGKEVEASVRKDKKGGIPWTAFLDAEGTILATSDGPEGNIGCPWKPEEIDWFMGMLKKVRNRITPEQLATLEKELRAYASEKPASRPH